MQMLLIDERKRNSDSGLRRWQPSHLAEGTTSIESKMGIDQKSAKRPRNFLPGTLSGFTQKLTGVIIIPDILIIIF